MEEVRLTPIQENGKWGLANETGEIVIPCQWDEVCYFHRGKARVVRGGRVYFTDKTGNIIGEKAP